VTPRGWLAGAIVVVAAGAVVGVGAAVQPPPSASQQPLHDAVSHFGAPEHAANTTDTAAVSAR